MPRGLGSTTININIAGSMDEAILEKCVRRMEQILGNVQVEASSSGTMATHKRIRYGSQGRRF
jgi:ABC-type molybdate transport system substrate-binding protein